MRQKEVVLVVEGESDWHGSNLFLYPPQLINIHKTIFLHFISLNKYLTNIELGPMKFLAPSGWYKGI